MNRKTIWLVIAVAISGFFIWLALRGLELDKVWANIISANFYWLIPSIAVYFVAVWVRTWRGTAFPCRHPRPTIGARSCTAWRANPPPWSRGCPGSRKKAV